MVDHAAISRQLRTLERWFGVALIDRSSNSGAGMTIAGQILYEAVARGLSEIASSSLKLMSPDDCHLTIWCEPALASEWLAGKLCDFATRYPGIEIWIKPVDTSPVLSPDFPDIQIHYKPAGEELTLDPIFRSTVISSPRQVIVAGPDFAASSIDITSADDVLHYRLLHEGSSERWRRWFASQGVAVEELSGPRFWHGHLILAAARRNQGLALSNALLASEGLRHGELIEITPAHKVVYESYYFIAPENAWRREPVAKFREWLLAALAE